MMKKKCLSILSYRLNRCLACQSKFALGGRYSNHAWKNLSCTKVVLVSFGIFTPQCFTGTKLCIFNSGMVHRSTQNNN